jgi:hypothetical protein
MTRSSKVYVLGAGMSVGAGIPTMDGLTKVVLAEENMRGDASMLGRFCAFAFPVYGRLDTGMMADMDGSVFAGERFAMNVEQFMAAIDAFRVFSDVTGKWKRLPNSPERLFPLFMSTLGRVVKALTPEVVPDYYQNFVRRLSPGDCIITFNWDCLVELTCDAVGVTWSYPELRQDGSALVAQVDYDSVNVLKMHGSVDWAEFREGLEVQRALYTRDGVPIVVQSPTDLKKERVTRRSLLDADVEPAEMPYLIPPSHFKVFPTVGLPGLLWTAAHEFLVNATQIEVIGYSLPITDYLPRWLLRLGILWNRVTGEKFVRDFSSCPPEEDLLMHLGVTDISRHLNELRLQGLFHDPYLIRDFWDRAALPIRLVDPSPVAGEHYQRLVGYNVQHEQCTAESYFDK